MANPEPIFVDDGLLRQAEQVCNLRLAGDPDNRLVLTSLAKIYRKKGSLLEATKLYKRLTETDPADQEAGYMYAILMGVDLPNPPAGIHPAPFVLQKSFLPSSLHETLLPFVLSIQDQLVRATVGNNEYKPEARESLELPGNKWDVKRRFFEYFSELIPQVRQRLQVAPFEIEKTEVKLRVYLDGHFFRIHMDCPATSIFTASRTISFVYFFHKLPRSYSGGDLLLYDTDIENNKYTTSAFTRIEPEDNSIVVFPSACYHSVIPIRCPSKEFGDSRFVINGHVNRRMEAKPEEAKPEADIPSEATLVAGVT